MTSSEWYHNYFAMPDVHRNQLLDKIANMQKRPIISLTVPVYNTREDWLRVFIDSVLAQVYPFWELCLCDNASEPEMSAILKEYADKDGRIRLTRLELNDGGWKGVQTAVDDASGEFCGLADSDDELALDALYIIAYAINRFPKARVIYTDELIMSAAGEIALPYFKPDFNRTLLLFQHYFGHLSLYDTKLIRELGVRHCGGSYDYDLSMRAAERLMADEIYHLPVMTYKYRTHPNSTSMLTTQECLRGGRAALQEHLDRQGIKGKVEQSNNMLYQIRLENGTLLPKPKIDWDEIVMAYPDYPNPNSNFMKLTFGV